MAQVGVEIQYGTKGAKDAENANNRLITSFDKMKETAGTIGVVGNQYLELAKKVYEGAKAFYEFAKAGAKTAEVRREFISFENNLSSTKDRIQEMTASALANSGVMNSLSGLINTFTSGLGEGTAAGSLFTVALRAIFEMLAWGYRPIQLVIEGINSLSDALGFTTSSNKLLADSFDEVIDKMILMGQISKREKDETDYFNNTIQEAFGDTSQKQIKQWADLVEELNELGGDRMANIENLSYILIEASSTEQEYKENLKKVTDELRLRGSTSMLVAENLRDLAKAGLEVFEIDKQYSDYQDEIDRKEKEKEREREAAAKRRREEIKRENYNKQKESIDNYLESFKKYINFLVEERNRVIALKKEIELQKEITLTNGLMWLRVTYANTVINSLNQQQERERIYNDALKQYRQQEIDDFNRLIDISSEAQNALGNALGGNAVAGIGRTNKVIKEMYKFIKEGNKSSLETTAQTVGGIAEIASAFMDEGWAKAGFQAAMETGYGIATAFTNPLESVSHFAAAAQFLIAQALAGKKSGKGSSSGGGGTGGGGTATGSGSNVINKQKEGDSSLVIEVDGTILGSVTGKSINKASRYGQVQIEQKSIVKSGRRMI